MSGRTPGPWRFVPAHIEEGESAVRAPEGWIVCTTSSDDDAAFIARAVNAHDDLVAALREIADGCDAYRPGHVNEHKNRTKVMISEIARAALAKAEAP